jgi:hypothetical protein
MGAGWLAQEASRRVEQAADAKLHALGEAIESRLEGRLESSLERREVTTPQRTPTPYHMHGMRLVELRS